jgi:hypothetical protein
MISFIKMGYRAGVGLGTIMPVSVQALGCADYLASSYASILKRAHIDRAGIPNASVYRVTLCRSTPELQTRSGAR